MSESYNEASSASTPSFVTALIVNSAIAGGEFAAFIVIRGWIKAIYEPRTYIPPTDKQAPELGRHPLTPLWRIINSDPEDVLTKTGVDPYVFLRFLKMMTKAMIPIWLISWLILIPVDSVGSYVDGKVGLDRLTFGNVATDKQHRYWAHLILDYVFIFWIMYLMWKEMAVWLVIRQKFLIAPSHSKLPQANTVLITGIPKTYMDEGKLAQLFSRLPGGVKRIWVNRNLKEMPDLYNRRDDATKKLESAQVNLIKLGQQTRQQTLAKIQKLESKGKPIPENLVGPVNPNLLKEVASNNKSGANENGVNAIDASKLSLADQLVPRNKRPMTRLKPKWAPFGLGFLGIGEKVDTIEWARKEIAECTEGLEKGREQLRKDVESPGYDEDYYPPLNSCFVHFNQQIAAHMAQQCLTHHQAYRMNGHYVEQAPENVIWRNLSLNPYEMSVRKAISWAITFGLILLWAFPVAFLGVLSSLSSLTEKYPWMDWLAGDSFGKQLLQGVVTGLLPPILLALLMLLLPAVLRQLAAFEGIPSKTDVELDVMTRYFIFLVIHTFFVVTLASGLTTAIPALASNPSSIANILAQQMPNASTFFITLVLTQFTGTIGNLLQVVTLAFYYIKVLLLGGTPRSVFNSRYVLQTTSWGTQFPGITVYAVIMLAYMIISPVINGFGACFFLLSYLIYKYLFIWVYDQPPALDTGGLFFPKAITHVFVGMYIQEICLCALFFLARDSDTNASAIPQGALMIVLIVITAAVHFTIHTSYKPLIHALPLSLAHLSYGMPTESGHENSVIGEEDENSEGGPKKNRTSQDQQLERDDSQPGNRGLGGNKLTGFDATPSSPTAPGHPITTATSSNKGEYYGFHSPPMSNGNGKDMELSTRGLINDNDLNNGNSNNESEAEQGESSPNEYGQPNKTRKEFGIKYFAVPGGPGVQRHKEQDADDPNAFFHPATKEPQRILWLPRDELGLCEAEIEANAAAGVESTCADAILNSRGKVEISGRPPDDL